MVACGWCVHGGGDGSVWIAELMVVCGWCR